MSEIENGRLTLCGTEHSKRNRLMTPGFKGLMRVFAYLSVCVTVIFCCQCGDVDDVNRVTYRAAITRYSVEGRQAER